MTNLLIDLFKDSIVEEFYDADLAGLYYRINSNTYGVVVSFSGFNEKMSVLVENIFEKLASFKIDPKRFNILKESVSLSFEQPIF